MAARLTFTTETIGPDKAREYMAQSQGNRRIYPSVVAQYAALMRRGDFPVTHQNAIAFDEFGTLIDGHHRLRAIVAAGIDVRVLIASNCPRATLPYVDKGRARTFEDTAHFMNDDYTRADAAIARVLMYGPDARPKSAGASPGDYRDLSSVIEKYRDGIKFATRFAGRRGVSSIVQTVIARAWYSAPHERLAQFANILLGATPDGVADSGASRLQHYLLTQRPRFNDRADTYARAESALQSFLRGATVTRLYPASRELFPLPDELTRKRKRCAAPIDERQEAAP